jgi:U3 small nucleolar RNA-associated protein 18
MGKHSRKRQRTAGGNGSVLPLGARVDVVDDASKDDVERRLESLLFGTPYVPSAIGKQNAADPLEDEDIDGIDGAGAELEAMLDADVRVSLRSTIFAPSCDHAMLALLRRRRPL